MEIQQRRLKFFSFKQNPCFRSAELRPYEFQKIRRKRSFKQLVHKAVAAAQKKLGVNENNGPKILKNFICSKELVKTGGFFFNGFFTYFSPKLPQQ